MVDVDVRMLASLARLDVSDAECETLAKQIPEILAFVDAVREAGGEVRKEVGDVYNVLRDDTDAHESGAYTDEVLAAMPATENGFLKVRKIITKE